MGIILFILTGFRYMPPHLYVCLIFQLHKQKCHKITFFFAAEDAFTLQFDAEISNENNHHHSFCFLAPKKKKNAASQVLIISESSMLGVNFCFFSLRGASQLETHFWGVVLNPGLCLISLNYVTLNLFLEEIKK